MTTFISEVSIWKKKIEANHQHLEKTFNSKIEKPNKENIILISS